MAVRVSLGDPVGDDVHAERNFILVGFGSEHGRVVADEVVQVLFQLSVYHTS